IITHPYISTLFPYTTLFRSFLVKILVVDDDKEIVELLSIYLKNEGYEPVAAYSGKEAITKLTTTPDIVLMILDVMMPNMSGIDRSEEHTSELQSRFDIVFRL